MQVLHGVIVAHCAQIVILEPRVDYDEIGECDGCGQVCCVFHGHGRGIDMNWAHVISRMWGIALVRE